MTSESTYTTNKFYVYQYYHPITMLPLYIGKGCDARYKKHMSQARNNSKRTTKFICKIKSMLDEGIEPQVYFIQENMSEDDAYALESELVEYYGKRGIDQSGILYNETEGGNGFNQESSRRASKIRDDSTGNPFAGERGSEMSKQIGKRLKMIPKNYKQE